MSVLTGALRSRLADALALSTACELRHTVYKLQVAHKQRSGSHLIDQAIALFGKPKSVTCLEDNGRKMGPPEVDDSVGHEHICVIVQFAHTRLSTSSTSATQISQSWSRCALRFTPLQHIRYGSSRVA